MNEQVYRVVEIYYKNDSYDRDESITNVSLNYAKLTATKRFMKSDFIVIVGVLPQNQPLLYSNCILIIRQNEV